MAAVDHDGKKTCISGKVIIGWPWQHAQPHPSS